MSTKRGWGTRMREVTLLCPRERLGNHAKIVSESTDYLRGQTYLNTGKDFLIMCTYKWVGVCVRVCRLVDSLWAVELSRVESVS